MAVDLIAGTSHTLERSDLYPPPRLASALLARPATGVARPCLNGSDAIESGCVVEASRLRVRTDGLDGAAAGCATGKCTKSVALWSVWEVRSSARFVLLGDLSRFLPLSGYRFRLRYSDPSELVVVGSPSEQLDVHYLARDRGGRWTVRVMGIKVGARGRSVFKLK